MTGYGKAETNFRGKKLVCEIRSLNSKSMDLSTRLNPALRAHELDIRTIISTRLERGKVDLSVDVQGDKVSCTKDISPINWEAAKLYAAQYKEQMGVAEIPAEVMASILRFPDVVRVQEDASDLTDEEWNSVQTMLNEAIERVQAGLQNGLSGEFLSMDLQDCLNALGEVTGQITNAEVLQNIFSKFCIGK